MSATNYKRPSSVLVSPDKRSDEQKIRVMASTIRDQETLNTLLQGSTGAKRLAMIERLLPYLPFIPEEIAHSRNYAAIDIGDCPYCGMRRGAVIPHACDGAIAEASEGEAN
jgi:hypothetical protein